MSRTLSDRCLALAGVFQATELVRQVARQGQADPQAVEATLGSLFYIDADSVAEVYGGIDGVRLGLQTLRVQLTNPRSSEGLEVTRYAVTLLQLERRLLRRRELLEALRAGIERISVQVSYFSRTHDTVIAALADLYRNTISTLTPRVIVHGEPAFLEDTGRARLIRALLLAGVRSAVLWRQSGGGRWNLLFGRAKLLAAAEQLLAGASPS
ncbi:MAG TPA: high frequency lysogenization protein HflD [Gammaproteobacteria bacterium]|nr:high frequency lysogenization protein HflD [Gammaproteobacteria bacterium]